MATTTYAGPRERLLRHFAARRTATDAATWLAQAWTRAVFVLPSADDDAVLDLLRTEWDAWRAEHPGEPLVAFRPPPPAPRDEEADPEPTPWHTFAPLRHGRYEVDMPSHEDRIRDEQERLARRDTAYYGF